MEPDDAVMTTARDTQIMKNARTAAMKVVRNWVTTLKNDASDLAKTVDAEVQRMQKEHGAPKDVNGESLPQFARNAYYVDDITSTFSDYISGKTAKGDEDPPRTPPKNLSELWQRIDAAAEDFCEYLTHGNNKEGKPIVLEQTRSAFTEMVNMAKAKAQQSITNGLQADSKTR